MGKAKRVWSPEDDDLLRDLYPDTDTKKIAEMFGVSRTGIYRRAERIGVRKSKEYIRRIGMIVEHGIFTRFKAGMQSPNKGKRQYEWMSRSAIERTKATRFKAGHVPHNAQPVGYETVRSDGYVWIKVEEHRRMMQKHVYVWTKAYGPVPSGMCVCFIDGDRSNCELSNLTLMTQAERARKMTMSLTREQVLERNRKGRIKINEMIRKDKMRIRWGMEPLTGLVKKWYAPERRV